MPASHDIALKIVATHDDDGQPRATSASTSHCVWKSTSSPPYFFGAVMRKMPARLSASKRVGQHAARLLGGQGALAQLRDERGRAFEDAGGSDGYGQRDIREPNVIERGTVAPSRRRQREGRDAGRVVAAAAAGDGDVLAAVDRIGDGVAAPMPAGRRQSRAPVAA